MSKTGAGQKEIENDWQTRGHMQKKQKNLPHSFSRPSVQICGCAEKYCVVVCVKPSLRAMWNRNCWTLRAAQGPPWIFGSQMAQKRPSAANFISCWLFASVRKILARLNFSPWIFWKLSLSKSDSSCQKRGLDKRKLKTIDKHCNTFQKNNRKATYRKPGAPPTVDVPYSQ